MGTVLLSFNCWNNIKLSLISQESLVSLFFTHSGHNHWGIHYHIHTTGNQTHEKNVEGRTVQRCDFAGNGSMWELDPAAPHVVTSAEDSTLWDAAAWLPQKTPGGLTWPPRHWKLVDLTQTSYALSSNLFWEHLDFLWHWIHIFFSTVT